MRCFWASEQGTAPDINGYKGYYYPEILQATGSGTTTSVNGRLGTTVSRTYRIEVYSNDATNVSGFGEGQRFVSAQDVVTDAKGVVESGGLASNTQRGEDELVSYSDLPWE
ncbi:MAG: hypothetical protein SGI99_06640 [Pseudomonadota bacterium]|nr:hypothetical protein [Pseudomonadota bacterium]